MATLLEVDYLVVGAGAMGMAFVDTLLTESDKTVAMVDRNARPGGHWITSYDYVRLHQPSAYYGVNSTPLGINEIDRSGWNEGLSTLAPGSEVASYFNTVMQEKFLPSGRVKWFPEHEYLGAREFRSVRTGQTFSAAKESCVVDGTYSRTETPSMRPPPYQVDAGVDVVAPNDLPGKFRSGIFTDFAVVGAGKTGIDACLWLLQNNVDPDRITWIMPRDNYYFNRECFQPGPEFLAIKQSRGGGVSKAVLNAASMDDFLRDHIDGKYALNFDENRPPNTFHCSTVSVKELDALRTMKNIVRKGRVARVFHDEVSLQKGSYKTKPNTLFVDCTANAIKKMPPVPVFQEGKIVLQPTRTCQQCFSAALIAHVESAYTDRVLKNKMCRPVPMPDVPVDFALSMLLTNLNTIQWTQHPKTYAWVRDSRLNMYKDLLPAAPEDPRQFAYFAAQIVAQPKEVSAKLVDLLMDSPHKDLVQRILDENVGKLSRL